MPVVVAEDAPAPAETAGRIEIALGPAVVRFTWQGSDEIDPASGAGDDATFKARRW